ncbi:uncharacterized protein LOC129583216 isoform X2 [Paramacrobiotus metropolitanus]|uniref:uncharacterized protein LOC129583216 isoform X2 n=1 Tax=Paramacrobiotus metropolitanus TaxID=2943436 RepID=UPI0024461C17|nr:uncharacterized protein LOC129583216 isoform X2 [Paramacrobiotus metropolitanus]
MAWHCGCCTLKSGCRFGALWTMIETIVGIGLLVASDLIAHGNILAIAATCYFVVVFCLAWVLLAGIFRESAAVLFTWVPFYIIFILIRLIFLGFIVTAYVQHANDKPVTFEIVYLADGRALSAQRFDSNVYLHVVVSILATMGISIVISAWIVISVILLGVSLRRTMWRRIRTVEYR